MQSFTWFFAGPFFGGDFFSSTPNVGGGYIKSYPKQTSTDIFLARRALGMDARLNTYLDLWGRPKKTH